MTEIYCSTYLIQKSLESDEYHLFTKPTPLSSIFEIACLDSEFKITIFKASFAPIEFNIQRIQSNLNVRNTRFTNDYLLKPSSSKQYSIQTMQIWIIKQKSTLGVYIFTLGKCSRQLNYIFRDKGNN